MTDENQDDLIEATIRRVAEAKARLEGAAPESDAEAPPPEATSAPVEAQDEPAAPPEAAAPEIDEDVIEATIRRVAAAKAAQAAAEAVAEPPADIDREDETLEADDADTPIAAPEPPSAPAPVREIVADAPSIGSGTTEAQPWQAALSRLEQEMAELRTALAALTARVDRELAVSNGARAITPAVAEGDDEEWEDVPILRAMPAGPPRPAIFRDTPVRAAIEPQPVVDDSDVEIDTRPLPEPPPPIRVEPKRGLDLLPRTYRITVEDKRRGVDLVPLHRALLGMENVRDMSLLSFANGVAIVSVETVDELDPQALEQSVGRAMSRPARAEVHNESTIVVKLAEE